MTMKLYEVKMPCVRESQSGRESYHMLTWWIRAENENQAVVKAMQWLEAIPYDLADSPNVYDILNPRQNQLWQAQHLNRSAQPAIPESTPTHRNSFLGF